MHLYSSFPTDILRHHSFFLRGLLKPFSGCRPQDVQFDDLSALSLIEGKNKIELQFVIHFQQISIVWFYKI